MTRCMPMRYAGSLLAVFAAILPRQSTSFFTTFPRPRYIRQAPTTCFQPTRSGRLSSGAPAGEGGPQEEVPAHLDRSAPPVFIENNNVSFDEEFVISREGEPTAEELSNENLLQIVAQTCTDEEVNLLLWKCLGYRYDVAADKWSADAVFPGWKKNFLEPPDLIGVTRIYEREVDQGVLKAVQSITRAVPPEHKRSIKDHLHGVGFTGYKVNELTPNRTRRAQATNFILYYRENLWGVSLEELQRRKRDKQETEARKPLIPQEETATTPDSPAC